MVQNNNDKPDAKLTPMESRPRLTWFGADRDKLIFMGDVISPVDIVWDAEQDRIGDE